MPPISILSVCPCPSLESREFDSVEGYANFIRKEAAKVEGLFAAFCDGDPADEACKTICEGILATLRTTCASDGTDMSQYEIVDDALIRHLPEVLEGTHIRTGKSSPDKEEFWENSKGGSSAEPDAKPSTKPPRFEHRLSATSLRGRMSLSTLIGEASGEDGFSPEKAAVLMRAYSEQLDRKTPESSL